jgi:hypothetical protein
MNRRLRVWALVMGGLVLAAPAFAQSRTVQPPRPGQVGIGLQGQFGSFLDSGSLGAEFGSGPGLAVRLRYRMRYERGFGLSFESQSFDVRVPADSAFAHDRLTMVTSGLEFYQMFGTRTKTSRMLSLGVGLVQPSIKLNDGETEFPNDGVYVSAGAGIEHFFWGSWAYDLSARYMTVFQESKPNHDFQVSAGLIFYATY